MIESIHIENYKSIEKLVLPLGRINVFIGENGAGKSNVLEAIALVGAAQANKLDNEFLASRGIRVSGPQLMRSAFKTAKINEAIKISVQVVQSKGKIDYELTNDNKPYSTWQCAITNSSPFDLSLFENWVNRNVSSMDTAEEGLKFLEGLQKQVQLALDQFEGGKAPQAITFKFQSKKEISLSLHDAGGIEDFIIYAPENSALRLFEREGQIEPLGINGEGLFKLLRVMSKAKAKAEIKTIKESLRLFSWFSDFKIPLGESRDQIEIFDQFLDRKHPSFDQRSANEGFLFVAFYLALFTSKLTPRFFAVDNVDASLNPKLCESLMRRLSVLAKDHDKQVLLTTHNPALLDGLDLGDPEHRLFVVSRGASGQTRVRRFERKISGRKPHRLSELFLSGALGGLPKGF